MLQSGILVERIIQNLSYYRDELQSHSKSGLNNQHIHAEEFLRKILNIIFDLNLDSLNKSKSNFPAIDLGDKLKSVAFQITGEKGSKKINKTLKSILKEQIYKTYKTINVFILSNKQKKYSINENLNNILDFSVQKNILDFNDLFQIIKSIDIKKLEILDGLVTQELPYLPNLTQTLNENNNNTELVIKIENQYGIELDDEEIEVYLMEIFHELKNNNMNFHIIRVKEEMFFREKLNFLNTLEKKIEIRKEIVEIKKIIDSIADLKQEINDKIKIFYFTYKFPITDDYKKLTVSLKELINKLTFPSMLIEESSFLNYFTTKPKQKAFKFEGDYKYDIYKDHKSGNRLGCSVWLTKEEIIEIKNKEYSFVELDNNIFFENINWMMALSFQAIDCSEKTITEKVIPSFVDRFYNFKSARYNFINKDDFKTWTDLPYYKVSLG